MSTSPHILTPYDHAHLRPVLERLLDARLGLKIDSPSPSILRDRILALAALLVREGDPRFRDLVCEFAPHARRGVWLCFRSTLQLEPALLPPRAVELLLD